MRGWTYAKIEGTSGLKKRRPPRDSPASDTRAWRWLDDAIASPTFSREQASAANLSGSAFSATKEIHTSHARRGLKP